MLNTRLLLVLGLLSSSALAADVFAQFARNGGRIGPAFDTSNSGCFAAAGATNVEFSQANGGGSSGIAGGPYCLNAFSAAACPGDANGQQVFEDVDVTETTPYSLNDGIANAGSYRWTLGSCDGS